MQEKLLSKFKKYNIEVNEKQAQQLVKLYHLVVDKNKEVNLTTILEQEDFLVKHLIDSALGVRFFSGGAKVLDLGSGAGFPALVLKILCPQLNIVMIDSVRKKVAFLKFAIEELDLKEIEARHERIEDFAKENAEKFDFVTSRAVANLSTLLEYSLPFLKINGKMIAYKGPSITEELLNVENALKILGGKVENIIELIIEENQRNLLVVTKVRSSKSGYPREKNLPRTKPLN